MARRLSVFSVFTKHFFAIFRGDERRGSKMVREVTSKEDFDTILSEAGDKLVVVDFTATWCGPCRAIAPEFARLANEHPNVIFIKVDVDKCKDVARAQGISAMPTFKFFKNETLYHMFRGASVKQLEDAIKTYSAANAEPNPNANAESTTGCVLL
jgi:thioredoxin